ncbi:Sec-independent protein translocase subunit TatA [Nonomuraea aurantiaca]|jgi:sec-independent protein translocase protein TatA|uniref:Sec-independent protein translocase subunit TatA n=1 Tax=Nonomuraea aurantiaca TaxID=2878562 RepID=UPI001CD92EE9|nr:Sec-independent protein translocase subunit TatA [Nonomuraea aurantiaca]MCA2222149.1 Sec-independent protein translocase subunit TatA [Nonomuraea aurantiaca]
MGNLGPTELLIIAGVLVLLFGAKKLPEMARGLGRSMRIFKSETAKLREDDYDDRPATVETSTQTPAQPQPAPPQPLQAAPALSVEEQARQLEEQAAKLRASADKKA